MLLVCCILLVLLIILIVRACQEINKSSKRRKQDKKNGIKRFSDLAHVNGLNAVEGAACEVVVDHHMYCLLNNHPQ